MTKLERRRYDPDFEGQAVRFGRNCVVKLGGHFLSAAPTGRNYIAQGERVPWVRGPRNPSTEALKGRHRRMAKLLPSGFENNVTGTIVPLSDEFSATILRVVIHGHRRADDTEMAGPGGV